ncbi:MAG: TonB-dependent receptor domain-containing protein [Rhodothalassiaceae bacterium]
MFYPVLRALPLLLPPLAVAAQPAEPARLETLVILGQPLGQDQTLRLDPLRPGSFAADSAALLRRVPGGALINNGAVSGQAQLRGLSGLRLNTVINGQAFSSGGPNLMDPPLHYAPTPLLQALKVRRGIAPVSDGPGLGGHVEAELKSSRFADSDRLSVQGDVAAQGQSVVEGGSVGGLVGVGTVRHRAHVLGHYERGGAFDFPGGTATASEYRRWSIGAGYGLKLGEHEISADYRHHQTGPTGNLPFPLDIVFFDSDFAQIGYEGPVGPGQLTLHLGYTTIDHQMDNFTVRPRPAGVPRIATPADSESVDYRARLDWPLLGGTFRLGADGLRSENSATVTQPDTPGFEIGSFNRARANRAGGFIEWAGDVTPRLAVELGLRYDRIATDADDAFLGTSPPVPPPVAMLITQFNAQERRRVDHNVDAVVRLDYAAFGPVSVHLTGARKTRSPVYVERYAFLPIEVTAGLADGNNTIGDIDVRPEIGYIIDGGFDVVARRLSVSVRGFYHRIADYIQSVPFDETLTSLEAGIDPAGALISPLTPAGQMAFFAQFDGPGGVAPSGPVELVSLVNGDATPLRFDNVEAEVFGVDAAASLRLAGYLAKPGDSLLFDAVLTYVRGRRLDIDDDLYRITPPRAVLALSYERKTWRLSVEGVLVAEQDRVSLTNGELPTDGYGQLNLYGEWEPVEGLRLSAGVENATNAFYRDHLAGFNRVPMSDIALFRPNPFAPLDPDARIPGTGIGGFVGLAYRF